MNKSEYHDCLEQALNSDDEKLQKDILHEMESILPRSITYRNLEARVAYDEGRFRDAISKISSNYSGNTIYRGNIEALEILKSAYLKINSSYNFAKVDALIDTLKGDFSYYERLLALCTIEEDFSFDLYKNLYACNETVAFVIYYMSFDKEYLDKLGVVEFFNYYNITNIGVLRENLRKNDKPFMLIKNDINGKLIDLVAWRLRVGNHTVYVYDGEPEKAQLELERIKKKHNIQMVNVIASGYDMDSLSEMCPKDLFRIERNEVGPSDHTLSYGKYGSYLYYLKEIYCEDIEELVNKEPEVPFSIVIPARNSSHTLRYTLETCLNQTYQGDYEILISDNSNNGDDEIAELVESFKSDKIRYIKTPRDLPLPKSFEYAFLHARGRYIFGLGSDDGILPWALEELARITETYPDEEVIQWERGFYAWPNFNKGQENELVIPRKYNKGNYPIYFKEGATYLAEVFTNPSKMYALPMLYINSCFKRSYLDTLMSKTGSLWSGICQDIYIGVVTAAINDRILYVEYPFTIAGMSSASIGAISSRGIYTEKEKNDRMSSEIKDNNLGGYCKCLYEEYISFTGTDTSSLYASILRAIFDGLIPRIYLEKVIPWEKWFTVLVSELDVKDIAFEKKLMDIRYAASLHGQEFLEWFDRNLYEEKNNLLFLETQGTEKGKTGERSYSVGETPEGGYIFDASEHNVGNIAEAVAFFADRIK